MTITVKRFSDNGESTLGLLYINGSFVCYTLEDEARTQKVYAETRIPEGTYEVKLRTEGGFHQRYKQKFGAMHKGMLHITNVPNFEYVLIHIGNDDDDTAGCLLVGDAPNNNAVTSGFIGNSTNAYKRIYPAIAEAILNNEQVTITYTTL